MSQRTIFEARRLVLLEEVLRLADVDGALTWEQLERLSGYSHDGARKWVLVVGAWLRPHGVPFASVATVCTARRLEFDYRALRRFVEPRIDEAVEVLASRDLRAARALRRLSRKRRRLSA